MNNGYNFNFNPNNTFMRGFPNQIPNFIPSTNFTHFPRISSLFKGAGLNRSASALGNVGTLASSSSKITFSGILNGASKTLGVINQAIPVFYQVKPIWNNARTMFKVIKGLNSANDNDFTNEKTEILSSKQKEHNTGSNAPVFFD